jgi:hypothetical protein
LCHALSDVEASSPLFYRCRTCGGPRIPPSASAPSARETALLETARAEQLRALAYRAGSGFALVSGLVSLVVTNVVLLATSPAPFAKAFALLVCFVPLTLSFVAFRRATRHKHRLEGALQQAWLSAAGRVAGAAGGELSASALGQALRIDDARAELLLAELSVQELIEPHALPPAKVRVTELADPSERPATGEPGEAGADASKL